MVYETSVNNNIMVDSADAYLMQVSKFFLCFAIEQTQTNVSEIFILSNVSEACTHFQRYWFCGICCNCKQRQIQEFDVLVVIN